LKISSNSPIISHANSPTKEFVTSPTIFFEVSSPTKEEKFSLELKLRQKYCDTPGAMGFLGFLNEVEGNDAPEMCIGDNERGMSTSGDYEISDICGIGAGSGILSRTNGKSGSTTRKIPLHNQTIQPSVTEKKQQCTTPPIFSEREVSKKQSVNVKVWSYFDIEMNIQIIL
jgi:hypothetical protein